MTRSNEPVPVSTGAASLGVRPGSGPSTPAYSGPDDGPGGPGRSREDEQTTGPAGEEVAGGARTPGPLAPETGSQQTGSQQTGSSGTGGSSGGAAADGGPAHGASHDPGVHGDLAVPGETGVHGDLGAHEEEIDPVLLLLVRALRALGVNPVVGTRHDRQPDLAIPELGLAVLWDGYAEHGPRPDLSAALRRFGWRVELVRATGVASRAEATAAELLA